MSSTSQLAYLMPYYVAMRHIFFSLISGALLMLTACTLPLAPPPTPPTIENDDISSNIKYSEQQDVYCDGKSREQLAFDALVYCANQDDPVAAGRLAEMYLNGEGVVLRNSKVAFYWFSKAAEGGLPYAEIQMGHFYRDGFGVEKDIRRAVCWYEKAAYQGDATAMIALGDLYAKGWHGVKMDRGKASYWYCRAASLGSYEAEYRKAWLLVRGKNH
ncbi:MAG TPA: tetratricopeptide repeat protein, partial [Gammaproteobacteria bacterium]|nr:tetratricopeptide repeat protein [Gammaproteobacteria bacterium]